MKIFLSILIVFLNSIPILAQEVKNISFELQQNKIIIYYDLIADQNEEYEVKLFLRREEYSGFVFIPSSVTGDIGEGKFAGTKRKITWDVTKDYHIDQEVTDYYFEITAEKVGGGIAWYYYVGGAVLAGGAAAVLLMNGDESTTEQQTPIGPPPIRP